MAEINSTESAIRYCELPENPGYRIGDNGTIQSRLNRNHGWRNDWLPIRTTISKLGYVNVRIRVDGRNKTFTMHRLVAALFIPNPDGKPEVNHRNGNKLDNAVGNLEWATKSENHFHAYKTGLRKKRLGELASSTKLTAEKVIEIRHRYEGGESGYSLAKEFDVAAVTIMAIVKRKTWRHITQPTFQSSGLNCS